jgi:group I intron endonuclease
MKQGPGMPESSSAYFLFWRKEMSKKIKRVIYRLWHNLSAAGRVGYIGKDKYHPKRSRLNSRIKEKSAKKLYPALNKYSLNAWKVEILAQGFRSDNALCKAEIFFIKKFDSKNRGYNCTDGGEGVSGCSPSEETREKLRESKRNMLPETREKLRLAAMGNKRCVGRRHSEETKKKIGDGNRGKVYSIKTRKKISQARKALFRRLKRGY